MMMTCATWNVNSVRARLTHVLDWLREGPVDVLCLQETKVTDDLFPSEPFSELGYTATTHGQKTYNGVAVLSRHPIEDVSRGLQSGFMSDQARLLSFRLAGVRFLNAYVPNGADVSLPSFGNKLRWLDELLALASSFSGPVVVLGDFNVAPGPDDTHSPLEQDGTVCYHPLERERIRAFLDAGFTDSFRAFHPSGKAYTWWDYRAGAFRRNMGMRLDLVLASRAAMPLFDSVETLIVPRTWEKPSDHAPVVFRLAPPAHQE
jgi:exodeoxyribonuclease-3